MNSKVEVPKRKNIILVFDVETTGLFPKKNKYDTTPLKITDCPYILQLSYALYDITSNKVLDTYDTYINVDKSVQIEEKITQLTGANRELCDKGVSIIDALKELYKGYMRANTCVAHNVYFDQRMVLTEIERNRDEIIKNAPECMTLFNSTYEELNDVDKYCTMNKGISICNIVLESKYPGKPPSLKWPKLVELYTKLFENENVEGLHNSMVDVLACLRCYMKMRHNFDCGLITI
tara:strand:+ start:130 stop:834 length:705 start_codon:yes stop_codon:yes gene_type:complete